jgi:hypothetical protein
MTTHRSHRLTTSTLTPPTTTLRPQPADLFFRFEAVDVEIGSKAPMVDMHSRLDAAGKARPVGHQALLLANREQLSRPVWCAVDQCPSPVALQAGLDDRT